MAARAIRVGCSGWNYKHWRGTFYPEDLPASRWFDHYARTFDTVEINNTFYRLPEEDVFDGWRQQAPRGFLYAVKASRYLTHMKKLKDPREPVERLMSRARRLEKHLGPILYQLPPRWRYDRARLLSFLAELPRDLTHVLELREESWYNDDLFAILREHGVSYCSHDMSGLPPLRHAVGPVAYVRFHGTEGKYGGSYSADQLRSWADWLLGQREEGRSIFAYFNNDIGTHAVRNAVELRELLDAASGAH